MQLFQHIKKSLQKNSIPQYRILEIQRAFDVPVDRLFAAFKSAETLKKWWWPKEPYSDRIDLDFREGGKFIINMKGYSQGGGGMTGQFKEIEINKRLVITDQFADENGNLISAKEANMPGKWPKVINITIDFEPIDEYTSRFTLHQEGIPNDLQNDCIQGWSESFDKLENYLISRKNLGFI